MRPLRLTESSSLQLKWIVKGLRSIPLPVLIGSRGEQMEVVYDYLPSGDRVCES